MAGIRIHMVQSIKEESRKFLFKGISGFLIIKTPGSSGEPLKIEIASPLT